MKVVINACFGGYNLSLEACDQLQALGHKQPHKIPRNHGHLVRVVEELGTERASGPHAKLTIIEVPGGINFFIGDHDGDESVIERGHTWE